MTKNVDFITIKQNENKINKRLKYFFYTLHLFLGLDFGYIKRANRMRTVLKMFCLFRTACVTFHAFYYVMYIDNEFIVVWWLLSMLFQHTSDIIILTISDKGSFYSLQNSLVSLDHKFVNGNVIYIDDIIILSCLASVAYRIVVSYFFCTHYADECIKTIFNASIVILQLFANDLLLIICFFIFYSVYLRLRTFNKMVSNKDIRVEESLHLYKSIVDMMETIRKSFGIMYVIALIVTTPNLIMTSYMGLNRLKNHSEEDTYVNDYVTRTAYCVQDFGLLFGPAISAGLLSSEVNNLKIILHDRLLQERYEEHATTIEVFISYVEARSLNFTVFRLIHLDWSLPIFIVNLCITYQIAVVQLTHLY